MNQTEDTSAVAQRIVDANMHKSCTSKRLLSRCPGDDVDRAIATYSR